MDNQKPEVATYVVGAILGLGLGVVSAHFYANARTTSRASGDEESTRLTTGDWVRFVILLIGFVRQIAEFGAKQAPPQKDQAQ
ncbi:MAG: hypothetical protein HC915_05260 [Anaerolineae bacterium]|nr:hypothetical protein [Anaerolineae bacterium]